MNASSHSVLYARLLARARLRHLQLLVATADHGNLRRAAEEVGMSQPAATQALAELEVLLEGPLFERHARGMRLTAMGQLLLPVVRQMLQALRASADSLMAMQQGECLLRVGLIPAAASALARVIVQAYARRQPGVRLDIREDRGDHLLQALASGGLEVVLCRRPARMPADLVFTPLAADETVVLAGLGHPLVGRPGLRMKDLAGMRWMLTPAGIRVREAFDAHVAQGLDVQVHPMSTTSPAFLVEILADNQTLALAPRSLGRALCDWQLVRTLDMAETTPLEGLGILASTESLRLPAVKALVEVLQAAEAAS